MTLPFRHTRRAILAGSAACLAAPRIGLAQSDDWSGLMETARGYDQLHALAVWVDGDEVLRERVRGPGLDTVVNVKSVAKTWVCACLGAAIGRGEISGLDATLGTLAPNLVPSGAADQVTEITVGDLASMQAGLERTSGGNYGAWIASGNWVANALGREMVSDPGGRMLYSTGSTHVLGAVLTEVTGLSLLEQMRARLADPMDVEIPTWVRDPQGYYMGGNQMGMTLTAMLRFGEMHRAQGIWNGTRVLESDWIDAAWEPRTQSPWSGLGYGLGWFLGTEAGRDFALARGYGGQVIAVAPQAGMVMAITSDPDQPARSEGYFGRLEALVRRGVRVARA